METAMQTKQCKYVIETGLPLYPCGRDFNCNGCPAQELISTILEECRNDSTTMMSAEEVSGGDIGGFFWNSNLFYTPSHFWIMVRRNGIRFGLDDLAQSLIGKACEVILPSHPFPREKKRFSFEIVSNARKLKLTTPFSGIINKVNISLFLKPELINTDPYGWGWLGEFDFCDFDLRADNLMSGIKSREWFISEFIELHRYLSSELGELYMDGGEINKEFFSQSGDEEWKKLVKRFLHGR
ncbi:MAG: hypothetical protein FJ088_12510 [Deltaproteobacteria bacterium]|nr:hypothetical protein [Deltaproteobacteria bacterium]